MKTKLKYHVLYLGITLTISIVLYLLFGYSEKLVLFSSALSAGVVIGYMGDKINDLKSIHK